MPEAGEGLAEAYDASVEADVELDVPAQSRDEELAEAQRVVAGAEAKVERQREHLAGAEQSLEAARATLAELGG